jgi:hypothetical protein
MPDEPGQIKSHGDLWISSGIYIFLRYIQHLSDNQELAKWTGSLPLLWMMKSLPVTGW